MTVALYLAAAACEIAGCYALWAWWRVGASALWLIPGGLALAALALSGAALILWAPRG